MGIGSLLRLTALAAIWGGSFLFMRVAVPAFGPGPLIEVRVVLAALFLFAIASWRGKSLPFRQNARHYLVLGLFNSALPFLLFAYAAQSLPVGLMSILNSTAPLFGAAVTALYLRRLPERPVGFGLLLGCIGVAMLAGPDKALADEGFSAAWFAGLLAPLCYGIASAYAKIANNPSTPFDNAHGSMWASLILMLPVLLLTPLPTTPPSPGDWAAVVALGLVCTGVAYVLYFRLIEDEGAVRALSVTFLMPVFGALWGWLFLDESLGWNMLAGGATILTSTALVAGWWPSWLSRRTAISRDPPP